jgi:hypothetical protein
LWLFHSSRLLEPTSEPAPVNFALLYGLLFFDVGALQLLWLSAAKNRWPDPWEYGVRLIAFGMLALGFIPALSSPAASWQEWQHSVLAAVVIGVVVWYEVTRDTAAELKRKLKALPRTADGAPAAATAAAPKAPDARPKS